MDVPEIGFGIGTLLVLAALVWGMRKWSTRDRSKDPARDEATRRVYDDPYGRSEDGKPRR